VKASTSGQYRPSGIQSGHYKLFSVKYKNHPAIKIKTIDIEHAPINAWDRIAWRYGWCSREDFIKESIVKEV